MEGLLPRDQAQAAVDAVLTLPTPCFCMTLLLAASAPIDLFVHHATALWAVGDG